MGRTPPALGKLWTLDVLALRVPAEHTGAKYHYAVIENVSKMTLTGDIPSYTEDSLLKVISEIRKVQGTELCRSRRTPNRLSQDAQLCGAPSTA